jgi:glucan phosphoethanolaminetransferase (alkaline phosphatase superfamily)
MIKNSFFSLAYVILCSVIFMAGDMLYSFYNSSYDFMPNKRNIVYPLALFLALSLISKLWLRVTLTVMIMLSVMAHFFYFQYFGNFIQPIAFMQIFQSSGEVFESLLPEFVAMIVPLLIVILLASVLIYLNRKFHDKMVVFKYSWTVFFAALMIHAAVIWTFVSFSGEKLDEKTARFIYVRPNRHSFENYMRSMNYFVVGILPKVITGHVADFPELNAPVLIQNNPDRNIIFVIGESLRDDRLSLLGFDQKTTPRLDSLNSAEPFVSASIYAGGTMTRSAFAVLTNRIKYPGANNQLITYNNNIFKLAKENGFQTHFISRQTFSHLEIVDNLLSKESIDHYFNYEDIQRSITEPSGYDEDLIPMLKKIDLNKNNLIVLHQRGSHSPFSKQYPEKFKRFEDPYDNTVLYTDHIFTEIYNHLKLNSPKETYFVFTSDHGEMLGEVKGKKGHGWFEKEVYKVPFIFIPINQKYPLNDLAETVKCHFDVSSLIQNLLGYDSEPETDPERTIYVNGSEMNALAGYMVVKIKDGQTVSEEIIR